MPAGVRDAAGMMHSAAHAPQEIGRARTKCTKSQLDFVHFHEFAAFGAKSRKKS